MSNFYKRWKTNAVADTKKRVLVIGRPKVLHQSGDHPVCVPSALFNDNVRLLELQVQRANCPRQDGVANDSPSLLGRFVHDAVVVAATAKSHDDNAGRIQHVPCATRPPVQQTMLLILNVLALHEEEYLLIEAFLDNVPHRRRLMQACCQHLFG